jgi:hypothetical protein
MSEAMAVLVARKLNACKKCRLEMWLLVINRESAEQGSINKSALSVMPVLSCRFHKCPICLLAKLRAA